MMETFKMNGCFPRPAYQQFEYGWVSSMDAPTIMFASELYYELTGEGKYREFCLSVLKYALESTDTGGV